MFVHYIIVYTTLFFINLLTESFRLCRHDAKQTCAGCTCCFPPTRLALGVSRRLAGLDICDAAISYQTPTLVSNDAITAGSRGGNMRNVVFAVDYSVTRRDLSLNVEKMSLGSASSAVPGTLMPCCLLLPAVHPSKCGVTRYFFASDFSADPSLRSLFVANIPKSATKDLLTAIFAEAQDIVLPLAEPGKNKGYCYIEFSEGGEKLDEYLTKYQDIKIEDGEVSAKIIIRKIGNSVTDKGKERASRMLKARSKQQIADLGKKSSVDSRKPRDGGKGNYRGSPYRGGSRFPRNERYDSRSRNYGNQYYGGRGGGPRDDRRDTGAAALAAIQQLLAKPMGMNRGRGRGGSGGGGGSSGGGGGSGSSGGFRRGGTKRRFPGGFDDYGGDYGMAKVARRYDGPMDMGGHSSHFYEDQYDSGWGGSSFSQGYGGGGGGSGGYMGGGGGGGGYGGGGGGGGMNDRRRKNFRGGKFNKR